MSQRAPKARPLPRREEGLDQQRLSTVAVPTGKPGAGPSLELALTMGALLVGAVIRMLLLDLRPLSIDEGSLAAEAYRMVQAQPMEALHQGPFSAYGTALLLAMFGGSDGAARLLSVLFGTALIGTPYLLRGSLGRLPALLATWAIAFSPVMLFASRSVGSGIVAVTLGMLLWAALDPGLSAISSRRLYAAAALLGCLLASGSEGVTVAVSLGAAALLTNPRPASVLREGRIVFAGAAGRRGLLWLVGTLAVVGTGFGANLGGIQTVAVDVWVNWVRSFSLSTPRGLVLGLMGLYELPVVLLGIVQLVRTLWRRDRTDTLLSLWTMLMLLLSMLQTTSIVARVVLPLLPLYLLAARLVSESSVVIGWKGEGWKWRLSWLAVLVPIGVGIVLLNRGSTPATDLPMYYVYGELALVALAGVALSFLLRSRERVGLIWGLFAVLGAGYLLHNTVYLNYRVDSLSREPLASGQITGYLRGASEEASYFTSYFDMPLTVDPQLKNAEEWYLRRAKNVQYSSTRSQGMLISSVRTGDEAAREGADRYPGIFMPAFDPADISWQGVWRWMINRDGLVRPNQRDIIVRIPSENW